MREGGAGRRLVQGLALLPWVLAVLLPEVGATRALLLAWAVELAAPGRLERHALPAFLLRHGPAWLLLHLLAPDGPAWLGAGGLLLAAATLPWWGCGAWRGGRRLRPALLLLLFAPGLLGFVLELAGSRVPAWLLAVDAWRQAAPAAGVAPPRVDLPAGLPPGAELASLDFRLPSRLWPRALEPGPRQARARLLVAVLLLLQGLALALPGRRRLVLQGAGLAVLAAAWPLTRDPAGVRLHWLEDAGPGLLLEVHRAGAGLWDPLRGALLAGPGPLVIRPEGSTGRLRVVAAGPWAVVRPGAGRPPGAAGAEEAAWIEVRPPGPVRSGGPEAALAILRLWVAGEPGRGGGVRWSLAPDGLTLWRRPPGP